jgi:hypothetical protein
MIIVALFIIAKRWKKLKYPPMDKWANKIWHIHTMFNLIKEGICDT